MNALTPTARPTGTSTTAGWYYKSFGIPAGYGSTNGLNPITLNTNTGMITCTLSLKASIPITEQIFRIKHTAVSLQKSQ